MAVTEPQLCELYERLGEILNQNEVQDLVDALDAVVTYRNGYGQITIVIERRRVEQIAITSTVKPGVS